jgi:nucleotide-binding universal stress UspA family protein
MYTRLLIPVDGSSPSDQAAHVALRLAKALGASAVIAHVTELCSAQAQSELPNTRTADDSLLKTWERRATLEQLDVKAVLKEQPGIAETLLEIAKEEQCEVIVEVAKEIDAQLVVVGTQGHTGLRKFFLGSVANEVAHRAKQPVLLVRDLNLRSSSKSPSPYNDVTAQV